MEQQLETQGRNMVITPQSERHMSKTAGWVLFFAIVIALFLLTEVLVSVLLYFYLEVSLDYVGLTALVLLMVPFMLLVVLDYNLFSYSILVKKAISNRDSDALNEAMVNKRLFWKLLTLYLILSLIIGSAVCVLFYFAHEIQNIF